MTGINACNAVKDLLLIPMDTVEHDSALCIRLVLYVRAATLI